VDVSVGEAGMGAEMVLDMDTTVVEGAQQRTLEDVGIEVAGMAGSVEVATGREEVEDMTGDQAAGPKIHLTQ
jgi:hypothetical protein